MACLAARVMIFSFLLSPICGPLFAAGADAISAVAVSKAFFNPTLGQQVGFSFSVTRSGPITILVLDRDGYLVRTLASEQRVEAGELAFSWDGRDDNGHVVPDEAYSLKIDLASTPAAEYFPADELAKSVKTETSYFDRQTGVFAYKLPQSARVHVQAGISKPKPDAAKNGGPVLKTLVNREPRPAGAVVETWNGMDETGSYYVPDLPGFVMAVAATSLPESSVITIGNREKTFLEAALTRPGVSLLRSKAASHAHHRGLSVLDDVSPRLIVSPSNASQSPDRRWKVDGSVLRGNLTLDGPSARHFARQPGALVVFVDEKQVRTDSSPKSGMPFEVSLLGLTPGEHIVAFDWASEYGPVAVSSLLVDVATTRSERSKEGRSGE